MKHARDDYNQSIQANYGLIPENEPVFLIRAKDSVSGPTVRAWADLAEKAGADPVMVQMARDHAALMDQWPTKEVPDLPV